MPTPTQTDLEAYQARWRQMQSTGTASMRIERAADGSATVQLGLASRGGSITPIVPVTVHIGPAGNTTSVEMPRQAHTGSSHLAPSAKLTETLLASASREGADFLTNVTNKLAGTDLTYSHTDAAQAFDHRALPKGDVYVRLGKAVDEVIVNAKKFGSHLVDAAQGMGKASAAARAMTFSDPVISPMARNKEAGDLIQTLNEEHGLNLTPQAIEEYKKLALMPKLVEGITFGASREFGVGFGDFIKWGSKYEVPVHVMEKLSPTNASREAIEQAMTPKAMASLDQDMRSALDRARNVNIATLGLPVKEAEGAEGIVRGAKPSNPGTGRLA